jgi:predicted Zn-dependent protease
MLDRIIGALERHPHAHDWTVQHRRRRSVQLYLIGREVESLREVVTEEFDLGVFNDHPFPRADGGSGPPRAGHAGWAGRRRGAGHTAGSGPARGVARLKLVPADLEALERRLEEAVLMAQLVHNPPYALPDPAPYPAVPLVDPALETAPALVRAAWDFADELWSLVGAEPAVRLSAAELFLSYTELDLRTSRGVAATAAHTHALAELVLLARGEGNDEAEHFRQIEARRLAGLRLPEHVREAATFTRDTLRAATPSTRIGPVVLAGDALAPLFDAFLFQASAQAAYNKLARFEVGQPFATPAAGSDRLTLRSNALRPYGLGSYRFDGEGVPGQDVLLVDAGVLCARHATQRYAQYLGIPATGEPGNTEVQAGATPLAALLAADGPVYHVVGFSSPDVDPITGDFGSEIRLGYEVGPQGARPIKGGSVSGNVFEAFRDARFSRETTERGPYVGPLAIRFGSLRVSGDQ